MLNYQRVYELTKKRPNYNGDKIGEIPSPTSHDIVPKQFTHPVVITPFSSASKGLPDVLALQLVPKSLQPLAEA